MLTLLRNRFAVLTVAVLLPLLLGVGGCAAPAPKAVADWHDAVLAVREQSTTTFHGVNSLVREAQIERSGNLASLKESDFRPGLSATSIAIWNRALDSLVAYSAALTTLLSPDLATGVGDSAKKLGESIATTSKTDLLTRRPGLASALGTLAAKVASLAAGESAKNIMVQTDGAVNGVLEQMAKMLSDDSGDEVTGVYASLDAIWTTKADAIRADFLDAKTPTNRRSVATQYATVLEQRDASEAALLGLRASLLELGVAHTRAAAGGPMDTSALIANIREQTAFFKSLLTDLKPAKK